MRRLAPLTVLLWSLASSACFAGGDIEAGWNAFASKDFRTAIRLWRPIAKHSDAKVQFTLGFLYRVGWGAPQDFEEAYKWLRMAADRGHSYAQSNLGFMYKDGEAVQANKVLAHMWLNLAASNPENSAAAEARDNLAKEMTAAQIAQAQTLAREWRPK
ncbi:sel1 repeat family protein [Bradyrhizobium sp. 190]|uniref:tetratricopeptide repeat protein n=1 Tax=Bradyrhizobium sp. 190 TaxID=2782658 RepID=UPI001FFB4ADE|nr:tetratricopeptide repeat protein [Bradyrhizobium sp. 190]MCK1518622.1 sel1 repeat family protein [Bradyrhizobium sp. 190]